MIAVLDPVKLVVDNYPADKTEYFDVANNPNREANDTTTRKVAFTKELWIENEDFAEVPPPKFKRLTGEDAPLVTVPQWLERDKNALKGTVTKMPAREDIDMPIEEHLIVELYSK